MIGVTFGETTEFRWQGEIIPFDLDNYLRLKPGIEARIQSETEAKGLEHWLKINKKYINDRNTWESYQPNGTPDQDDIYIELLFLHGIKTFGPDKVTARNLAETWLKYLNYDRVWHASKTAYTNFKKGIWPPESGHPQNNPHYNDIDFQIESDLFGLISPGLPQVSNTWCNKVGHLMNYRDGLYGGMFVSCMYTIAFFEKDPARIVEWGLSCIPPESDYANVIQDVIGWYHNYPDWRDTWKALEAKWGNTDTCPEGINKPLNIDAKINGAYIVIGLLYGNGDFGQTMNITARCGQDSDCNPSNAAGILGCALGAKNIPDKWKAPMNNTIWNNSLNQIYPQKIKLSDIVTITAKIGRQRSEEHTSELQSHSFISYAVFCLKKKKKKNKLKNKLKNTKPTLF